MVADHLDFLHSACKSMVENEQKRDLQNMFKLLKPIKNGLSILVMEIEHHITETGLDRIRTFIEGIETQPQSFVDNMLSVHRKYLALIKQVFNSDQLFIGALDKACSHVINHRIPGKGPPKSPEYLSRYCDNLLKKSSKSLPESELEEKLGASITIFKYIEDKDVFQKFYAKMLAKRLIHSQSASMDAEETMINKLKAACGHEFTSKLHRMFTDIKVSEDLNGNFSSWSKERLGLDALGAGMSFSILVLQAGAWPLAQTPTGSTFAIPHPLEKAVTHFEQFYNSKFNGRKLTFLHHLSTSEMKLLFPKKPYSLIMGTYHMAILLLFETVDSLTYRGF